MKLAILVFNMYLFSSCVSNEKSEIDILVENAQQSAIEAKVAQKVVKQPYLPTWEKTRNEMILSLGDRVFNKSKKEIMEAIPIAFANIEINVVQANEYIVSGSGKMFTGESGEQLKVKAAREVVSYHGGDFDSLKTHRDYVLGVMSWDSLEQKITATVREFGEGKTKVMIRVTNVNYPDRLEKCYKAIWNSLDKQLFMDKNL